jgi:hypothetical protein
MTAAATLRTGEALFGIEAEWCSHRGDCRLTA